VNIQPPRVNGAFVLAEADYRYEIGPVLARITNVVGRVEYQDESWWAVQAKVANGTPDSHGGWRVRELYIREAALTQIF
jgi:hypothetical protein